MTKKKIQQHFGFLKTANNECLKPKIESAIFDKSVLILAESITLPSVAP